MECNITDTRCTSCISNYFWFQYTCGNSCPSGTIIRDQYCLQCSTNCANCQVNNQSKCLGCSSGYYLYSDSCYKVCPNGYVVDSTTKSVCVPPSFDYGSSTDKPYLYFPVLITQTILGGVSIGSYFKDPTSLVFSNSLALWGPLEFIAYAG